MVDSGSDFPDSEYPGESEFLFSSRADLGSDLPDSDSGVWPCKNQLASVTILVAIDAGTTFTAASNCLLHP
jgi:hypothetical protein